MKYRPHRGGLAESMAEAVELSDYDGLLSHMRTSYDALAEADPSAIIITPYGDDERIGWRDVHMVSWIGYIGFTEGDPRATPRRS